MTLRYLATVLSLSAALALGPPSLRAQEHQTKPVQERSGDVINYAYAATFGSGVYAVAGRSVQIYKVPFSHRLRRLGEHRWGATLQFPVTLGFYDFKARDVLDSGLPEDVETITFVPGVEFQVPLGRDWSLEPFAHAGVGKDFSGGGWTYIYSAGVRSYYRLPWRWRRTETTLGNDLYYVGHTIHGARSGGLFAVETGLDLRWPLRWTIRGRRTDASLYVANYLYLNDVEFARQKAEPLVIDSEYEVGVTFGREKPWRLGFVRIPRVGLSYRFGDDLSAVRLTLGYPF